MSQIFPDLPQPLGSYILTHQLGAHENSEIFAARQEHVDRQVIIEVLYPGSEQTIVNQFLKTARARVAAKLPGVTHVFESMVSEGTWYITQEKPTGTNLESYHQQEEQLTPSQICIVLEAVAQLYIACDEAHLQAAPLTRADIFLTQSTGGIPIARFLSPVYDNKQLTISREQIMQVLADELQPILPTNMAGQTRVATLIQWIREGYEGQLMDWHTVADTAKIIREQLGELENTPLSSTATQQVSPASLQRAKLKQRRAARKNIHFAIHALLFLIFCAIAGVLLAPTEPELISPDVGDYLVCKQPNKKEPVYVAKEPVSILAYEQFLAAYAGMSKGAKARILRGLPDGQTDFTPRNWKTQLKAANAKSLYQGRKLSPGSPVTGVSFWAARAYATYVRGSLPGSALLAEVRSQTQQPDIQEWTNDTQAANVVTPKCHLVMAAEESDILYDPNPGTEHESRGFRIVYPTLPTP